MRTTFKTWSRRVLAAAVFAVVVTSGETPNISVLGRHDDRPAVTRPARSRRVQHVLSSMDLRMKAPVEGARDFVEVTGTLSRGRKGSRTLDVDRQRVQSGSLPVLRSIEPSHDELVMVATDDQGRVRYSAPVTDPLVIRAEFPDADGTLHAEEVERRAADIVLRVPDDPAIVEISLYRPTFSKGVTSYALVSTVGLS